jgi:hypothetical protein
MKAFLLILCLGVATCRLSNSKTCQDQQGNIYTTSFTQVSSDNQDASVRKTTSAGGLVWLHHYDKTPIDSKAILCFVDEQNELWVVFTVDGGSYDSGYITKHWVQPDAFTGVVAGGYGSGGGPVAAIIARVNKEDGRIIKGTFLSSILSSGKTNSLAVQYIGTEAAGPDAPIVVYGKAASTPVLPGKKLVRDASLLDSDRAADGYFAVRYELNRSLSEILAANGKFRGEINTNWSA